VNFRPPPAYADEEKTPVLEKLWWLAFEGVADELENPAQNKKSETVRPEAVNKDSCEQNQHGNQNGWNAQGVAATVYGVLVAGGVLRDPLLVGAVAQHGEGMIHPTQLLCTFSRVEASACRVVAS
jgi:hypothetical protein